MTSREQTSRIDTEQQQIRQATQRLLDGSAQRSNGTLTVSTLATEANLSRQRLYEYHPELIAEFKTVATGGPTPPNIQALQQQIADERARNAELKASNIALQERVRTLSALIVELTHEMKGTNVVTMPRKRTSTSR